ncbi:6-phospho-beta-glucosidase [Salisediminibacterium beveridgei]|uniref:6-phospho-beta-glucosidase n=1 Tax=Salisediminibacterium beveridgei TaxID=632773 RepID=A0A1D7QZI4_9BACI|nr:6-phospho-beta-glucosidase [Salisediminibacterium beveridgei]AOM84416.1 6-phospho-beta-glucosidase [Salisediminibacterium beveridgei]
MGVKIVIIGGGSSYTPEIIEGFIDRYEEMPVDKVVLVDIPDGLEKLNVITNLSERMIRRSKKSISIEQTMDLEEALQGADFVTTQIRVGGLEARAADERIPLQEGLVGQETNGAGGVFKAFRTIPVLINIADSVSEICPNAWLINFTNPAGIVTEAIIKHSKHKKVIGVCNIPFNMRNGVAEMFNVPVQKVQIEFIGLNHFIFGRKVMVNGEDRTQETIEKMIIHDQNYSPANIVSLGWKPELLRSLGMLPNPYHQYYFQTSDVIKKDLNDLNNQGTRAETVQRVEADLFKRYRDLKLNEKPKELEQRGGAFYSDAACNLIVSIYTNKQDIQTVNTVNHGALSGLDDDAVIEVNAMIDKDGPHPIQIGDIPIQIKGLIQRMKNMEELTIKAACSGNYEDAYLALLMNPLVADETLAKKILDQMIEAHHPYLPQFQKRKV